MDTVYLHMMSETIAYDFIEAKEKFKRLGLELIGTKDINEEIIFLVKEKSKN